MSIQGKGVIELVSYLIIKLLHQYEIGMKIQVNDVFFREVAIQIDA
jgi:hypothetical protein